MTKTTLQLIDLAQKMVVFFLHDPDKLEEAEL